MSKFNIVINQVEKTKKVHIEGVLDEDFIYSKYPLSEADEVEFYLGKLKNINSCGIREWINWLGTIKSVKIKLIECPKVIVDQINMVQGFISKNAIVESFYVPYFNEEAGTEKNVLFSLGKEYTNSELNYPKEITDESGRPMELDVIESKYFKFLKK